MMAGTMSLLCTIVCTYGWELIIPITSSISSATFDFELIVCFSFFWSLCFLLLMTPNSLAHVKESFCFSSVKISRGCLLLSILACILSNVLGFVLINPSFDLAFQCGSFVLGCIPLYSKTAILPRLLSVFLTKYETLFSKVGSVL